MRQGFEGYGYENQRYLDRRLDYALAEEPKPRPAWRCLLRVKAQVSGKGKPFYRLTIGDRRLILLEEAGPDGRPELLIYAEPNDGA